jgi:Flp pilus assembly protein TadG
LTGRHGRGGRAGRDGGQIIVLFALIATVIILSVGLVIDGGFALAQRRTAQNGADFAALAGARVLALGMTGTAITDGGVRSAVDGAGAANGGLAVTYGNPGGARYVDATGTSIAFVGGGSIPAGAIGVSVTASRSWTPFFLGLAGISGWSASATATALARPGPRTGLLPISISETRLSQLTLCPAGQSAKDCGAKPLTPIGDRPSGGKGWLIFGCFPDGGQDVTAAGACSDSTSNMQRFIGPPPNSLGCCTAVPPGGVIRIGSFPGNEASLDLSYYVDKAIIVILPVYDDAHGTGSSGYYDVIGWAGFELTHAIGARSIHGVWRIPFFTGPTNSPPGLPGDKYHLELVR